MTCRRAILATAVAMLAQAPVLAAADSTPAGSSPRPNILYVYPDELRPQALGFMGREPVLTPRIDRFARESLVLDQAVSNYPVCVPHRTMLMSGRYPLGNGVTTNCFHDDRNMKDDVVWLPDVLHAQGYTLGYVGKWHITKPIDAYRGVPLKGVARDFVPPEQRHHLDYWFHHTTNDHLGAVGWMGAERGPEEHEKLGKWSAENDADGTVRYLLNEDGRQRDPTKPFCLFVSMNPPHSPYGQVPRRYLDLYADLDVTALAAATPDLGSEDTRMGKYGRAQLKNYYACISGVDEQFGRILDALHQSGLDRNTIVVFSSDHGNCLGRHDEVTKNNSFEESFRVPFIIRWPEAIAPRRDGLLLSTPDIHPTLLGLVGCAAAIPAGVEGGDLSAVLRTGNGSRPVFQPYYFIPNASEKGRDERGVRTATHTLVINIRAGTDPIRLFNHVADPYELRNLASERKDVVATLVNEHLVPWLRKTQDPWLAAAAPILTALPAH